MLLSLLIMSGIVTAGIGMGTLILNELRQSRNIDNSVIAFSYAEAGIEEALYLIRKVDKPLDELGLDKVENFDEGSFDRRYSDTDDNILTTLDQNQTLTVDLYNPEGGEWATEVESIRFSWDDDCGGDSRIELTYFDWQPGNFQPSNVQKRIYTPADSPVTNTGFSPGKAYQIKLKALYCDVYNLKFEAFDNNNPDDEDFCPTPADCLVQIPNRSNINSTGSYRASQQNIEVIMPRKEPISGFYDYVIFSEESLVK